MSGDPAGVMTVVVAARSALAPACVLESPRRGEVGATDVKSNKLKSVCN